MSMSPILRMKELDINNLETQEGKDVKFFFESKITELYHEYYEYQNLYNAIHKLPLFRDRFNDYENKLTDNDLTIKKLQDEITRLQSDVFRDRFDKYEKELKEKQDIIDNLSNEVIRLNTIIEIKEFINNNN